MCMGCYETFFEDRTKPVVTDKMRSLAREIQDFYEEEPCGGALHIVLDDWNLDDEFIEWCLSRNNPVETNDEQVANIGKALLSMTIAERYAVLAEAR